MVRIESIMHSYLAGNKKVDTKCSYYNNNFTFLIYYTGVFYFKTSKFIVLSGPGFDVTGARQTWDICFPIDIYSTCTDTE